MTVADRERHGKQLEEEGYTILPEVLSRSEIELTKVAIDETLESEADIARRYGLQNENLLMAFNAQGKHPHFYGLLTRNPEPVEVTRTALGDDMFAHDVAIRKPLPTGKKDWTKLGGYLHADWHHFTVTPFLGGKHYPLAVQSAWCVSEFTRENGAALIWPGSHLSLEVPPEQPQSLPTGYIYTEAPAGSVILWDSALWHTSGTNCSTGPRYSLVFYFHRWWVKGFNDAYRLVPEWVRNAMSVEERCLWGLEAAVPPNTHFRGMSAEQIAALTPEERAVLNIAAF